MGVYSITLPPFDEVDVSRAIDMATVNENELRLIGTARYVIEDFEVAKQLVASGKVNLEPLVTDVFSFEEYSAAYKKIELEPATTMKVVVEVNK